MESAVIREYGDFVRLVFQRTRQIVERRAEPSLRADVTRHLATMESSKGMRPALVACAARLTHVGERSDYDSTLNVLDQAVAVQLVHEATLVVDDIIDDSSVRRHAPALHTAVGAVVAGAAAAEMNTIASELLDVVTEWRELLRRTGREIAVAEATQERDRGHSLPYPLPRWERVALGDTGALLFLAAGVGGIAKPHEIEWLRALAILRHGLDDVDDLVVPGGDQADVRMKVGTLPACFAAGWSKESLVAAIPRSLSYLQAWLAVPHPTEAEPFFEDFRSTWAELSSRVGIEAPSSQPSAPRDSAGLDARDRRSSGL